jgi:hypothetical protein
MSISGFAWSLKILNVMYLVTVGCSDYMILELKCMVNSATWE